MAGIYIHIPFCKRACHYCDFHFSTSFQKKDEMIGIIVKEILLQTGYLEGQGIGTIYFGGGTPSAVPPSDIKMIIDTIGQKFNVSADVEITLETNPDDIRAEALMAWSEIGINRLSIGIQAFQEDLLKAWNRSHTSGQAKDAIALSQQAGFINITADLIYGGQGLTDEDWIQNVQTLIDSGIPHISSYALTVEKGTALAHQISVGKVKAPEDEQSNRQYSILQSMLKLNGFEQYEVSNFSKPGLESKHNMSYWSGAHYLGIGPSAHSFNGVSRQWNIANNIKYIHSLDEDIIPFEKEMLTDEQRYNEIVMTGLRTSHGIDMNRVKGIDVRFEKYLNDVIHDLKLEEKLFKNEFGNWTLKPEYYFFADGIAAELFYSPG
ncbi:MAG: radical SAM family heme chaperone HemW [Saprospiraceae bacterium]|uniref:Heme chaperone HemW n=1 Tax=Candidatus Opimibacter skivensis TaxID=2982028 RepID=A0A9D7STD7_9BACT|nr:radical SAM family heme chaperone HemW [Candidatus Opimibacter skivensis]